MNELDDQIRDALQAEHKDLLDDDEDWQAHFESLKFMFRGHTKWLTVLHVSAMIALVTLIVISAIQFFRVDSVRWMIAWATGFAVFVILQVSAELYFILEWNKQVLRRELKQLELQVALAASAGRSHGKKQEDAKDELSQGRRSTDDTAK